jgi:hypoxanthine phosphoribosyltransferase
MQKMKAKSIIPVCLLYKPTAYQYKKSLPIRYKGFSIPDDFVVGYGLDCDGKHRTLPNIYRL